MKHREDAIKKVKDIIDKHQEKSLSETEAKLANIVTNDIIKGNGRIYPKEFMKNESNKKFQNFENELKKQNKSISIEEDFKPSPFIKTKNYLYSLLYKCKN